MSVFKEELDGLLRLGLCWVGAYALTWIYSYLTKGNSRLVVTLFFIAILLIISFFRP